MVIDEDDYLEHYGTPRKSGRYPWGSGGNDTQRNKTFLDHVDSMKKQGYTEGQIAEGFDCSIADLRAGKSIAKNQIKQEQIATAWKLKDKGMSNTAAAKQMGIPEPTFRTLLAPGAKEKADILITTSDMLMDEVNGSPSGFIDIGKGVANHVGISNEKLNAAVSVAKEKGYEVHTYNIRQQGTGENTRQKVLGPPGSTQKDAWLARNQLSQIGMVTPPPGQWSDDGGRTLLGIMPPRSVSMKRVGINYKEDGGGDADGVIYIRPGVKDLTLGGKNYAQVRVLVGGTHYLKGMAMYKDGLPEGSDLVFNTNKTKKEAPKKTDVLKEVTGDPDNPFGAMISKQIIEKDSKGNRVNKSAMNIVNEEGDWSGWTKTLSSQVLSKQSPRLAKTQLNQRYEQKKSEFDEIQELTNPTVRRRLLKDFAGSADSSAVHLEAAALPKQRWHAILPLDKLPPHQVYAPNFENGETVVLIRYPHGGKFEIPELTVNNKNPQGVKLLGKARDAVGIHPSVAKRLSGADFDGDTVLVIPNAGKKLKVDPALKELENFDVMSYRLPPGAPKITKANKQKQMGVVSNLITDMTIHNASPAELSRAIRHSMVVIDAEKHGLDHKRSARDFAITELQSKYQKPGGGASTLISRAKAETWVPELTTRKAKEGGPIDLATGKIVRVPTNRMVTNKKGEKVPAKRKFKALDLTEDAHSLSSGTRMEVIYAEHSNKMKALANDARRAMVNTPSLKYSPTARKTYAKEVASLNAKLDLAIRNAPLERRAQAFAGEIIKAKMESNPNLDDAQKKKVRYQALEEARKRTGAKKHQIKFTDAEWDAVQAGAISDSKLDEMLNHADMDRVHELATPKTKKLMTPSKAMRAQQMMAMGATRAEIANQLGVSLSTLDASLYG